MPKYNGWTNKATWAVHLWLTDDESSYAWAAELVGRSEYPDAELELAMRADLEEYAERVQMPGLYRDLLTYALAKVDWPEVAAAFQEQE